MIVVAITAVQIERAKNIFALFSGNHNSLAEKSSFNGILCEEIFASYYPEAKRDNDIDKDFIYKGFTVDIKSRSVTDIPTTKYDVRIFDHQKDKKCDLYFWVIVNKDLTLAWLVGYYSKYQFWQDATPIKKGDIINGWTNMNNQHLMKINQLRKIRYDASNKIR